MIPETRQVIALKKKKSHGQTLCENSRKLLSPNETHFEIPPGSIRGGTSRTGRRDPLHSSELLRLQSLGVLSCNVVPEYKRAAPK